MASRSKSAQTASAKRELDKRWHASDEDILDALQICIDRYGAKKFTMAQVANQVGLTRVQIYNRFGNREQLVWAYLIKQSDRFNEEMREQFKSISTVGEKMHYCVMAAIKASLNNGYVTSLLGSVAPERSGDTIAKDAKHPALEMNAALWVPILEDAINNGEISSELSPREISDLIAIAEFSLLNAMQVFDLSLKDCDRIAREAVVKLFN